MKPANLAARVNTSCSALHGSAQARSSGRCKACISALPKCLEAEQETKRGGKEGKDEGERGRGPGFVRRRRMLSSVCTSVSLSTRFWQLLAYLAATFPLFSSPLPALDSLVRCLFCCGFPVNLARVLTLSLSMFGLCTMCIVFLSDEEAFKWRDRMLDHHIRRGFDVCCEVKSRRCAGRCRQWL